MERIAWGKRVSDTFLARVQWIVEDLAIGDNTLDGMSKLMACMAWESGRTFSASVVNKAGSGATGLIQFMPSTAEHLGTTTAALAKMTPENQLNFVWKYFAPFKGKLKTLGDLYMAILWPAGVGKPETYPLWAKQSKPTTYRQNAGLDTNKDGYITKSEATGKLTNMLNEGFKPENAKVLDARKQGLLGIRIDIDDIGDALGDVAKGVIKTAANDATGGILSDVIDRTVDKVGADVFNHGVDGSRPSPEVDAVPVAPAAPATVQYETETSVVTVDVAPNNTVTAIKKAASGWQGNVAGIAVIVSTLMLNPDFMQKVAGFLVSLSKGEGSYGLLISLVGAGLIAYKSKSASQ